MVDMQFKCPVAFEQRLRDLSEARQMPMSRLIAIAVDNELHKTDKSFDQGLELPDVTDYEEFEFCDEAGKIANFLNGLSGGTGLDVMMLLRNEIGIPDKHRFLGGFAELLKSEQIVACKPTRSFNRTKIAPDYKVYKTITNIRLEKERKRKGKKK